MLKIKGLQQYYGESHTLWDLQLDVPKAVSYTHLTLPTKA